MKSVNMDWIPGSKFLDEPPLPIAKVIDYMSNDSVLDAKSTGDQMEILPAVEDNSRHLEPFILHPHNILPGASSLRWTFNMGNYSSWRFQRNKDRKTLGNKFEGENSDGLRKRTDCTSGFSTYGEQTCAIPVKIGDREIGVYPIELRISADESLQQKDGASPKMERKRRSEDSFSENVLNENITNTNENLIGPSKKNKSSKHTKVKNKREPASNPVIDDEVESIFRKPSTKSRKRTLYSPCTFEKSRDMAILFSDVIDESIREFGRLSHSWIETPSLI